MNYVPASSELLSYGKPKQLEIDFDNMPVGMSVSIPIAETDGAALRIKASKEGKRLNRVFRCIKHDQHGVYEVGRLPDGTQLRGTRAKKEVSK